MSGRPLVFRRGEQYEVGAKLEFFQRRLAVNLAWFDITLTNFQLNNPEASFNPLAPRFLLTDLTSDGWEVEVIGSVTEDLSVVGSVSRSKARDVFGRPERGAPDEAAAVLFDYRFRRFGWKGLSASVGIAHTGRRSGDTATAITAAGVPQQPTFWLASNTIVNFGAAYVHGPMTYRLLVDNALDKTYIGTAASRGGLDYGMKRNVRLTASYRF